MRCYSKLIRIVIGALSLERTYRMQVITFLTPYSPAPCAKKQVIKNIKNVAGCRETRTAKIKETRGMIEHNSEVYNPLQRSSSMYNEKRYVGVIVYFTVMFDHPSFPYFLPFWYPYILLHF